MNLAALMLRSEVDAAHRALSTQMVGSHSAKGLFMETLLA
jgi:hypothetical protein